MIDPYMTAKKESRSRCWNTVGGNMKRWYSLPDDTAPIISKMEDFTMSMYHFTCVAPFVLWCLIGAVASWKNL